MRALRKYVQLLGWCGFALSVGLWSARRRKFLSTLYDTFFAFIMRARGGIPIERIGALAPEDGISLRLFAVDAQDGNVTTTELVAIVKLVVHHKPQAVFEIGTFDGRTILNIAANVPAATALYTLDLPREKIPLTRFKLDVDDAWFADKPLSGARYQATPFAQRITQLYGDSAKFDFSAYVGKIDCVFVDGAHSYDYVLQDSMTAMRLVRPGKSIIIWHDYGCWEGVTRALNHLYATEEAFRHLRCIAGTSLVFWKEGA